MEQERAVSSMRDVCPARRIQQYTTSDCVIG
jgi:hypothetical protein